MIIRKEFSSAGYAGYAGCAELYGRLYNFINPAFYFVTVNDMNFLGVAFGF